MRRRTALVCFAVTAMMGLAGCSGQAARTASSYPAPLLAARKSSPGCSTGRAAGPALDQVRTAMTPLAGNPFGAAVIPDGRWAFVAQDSTDTIEVLRTGSGLSPTAV